MSNNMHGYIHIIQTQTQPPTCIHTMELTILYNMEFVA